MLAISGRLLLALAVLAIAFCVSGCLPALFKSYRRWLASLGRELNRPTDTWSSTFTYVSVWVVGLPILLATLWYIVVYTFAPASLRIQRIVVAFALGWTHLAIGIAVIAVLLLAVIVRADPAPSWFYDPHKDDVDRAQQVHPSIEACEGRLVGGTAHMISLTDMRAPNWWSVGGRGLSCAS